MCIAARNHSNFICVLACYEQGWVRFPRHLNVFLSALGYKRVDSIKWNQTRLNVLFLSLLFMMKNESQPLHVSDKGKLKAFKHIGMIL